MSEPEFDLEQFRAQFDEGAEIAANYAGGFLMKDGRPIGSRAMWLMTNYQQIQRQREYEDRGTCCKEGPRGIDGFCSQGLGRCPVFKEARERLGYIEWENQRL